MTNLRGTTRLMRLILRLDRVRLAFWVGVLSVVPVGTASAFNSLYPTEVDRQALEATIGSSPALSALLGPLYSTSIGGLTAWRIGTIATTLIGVMAVLTVIRHTRVEEETGRRELLGATVLGRHAPMTAALAVTAGAALAIGLLVAVGLMTQGLETSGAAAFGLALALAGLVFAGVGALAAQLTESSASARGIAIAFIGASFLFRLAADVESTSVGSTNGLTAMSWVSPIGWFTRLRPFGGEKWWVIFLWLLLAIILLTLSFGSASRRDVGSGAFPSRPGPARADRGLGGPFGLAWRLQRGALGAWAVGLGILGMVYGGAGNSISDMIDANPQLAAIFEEMGGQQTLTDTFFSVAIGIIALLASAYAIRSVLRLRSEEEELKAEQVLATATPRSRWVWSHLLYGLLGPALILVLAGSLAGIVYGLIVEDVAGQLPRVLAAAMSHVPAVWVLAGVALALFGLIPEHNGWAWGVLAGCLIAGQLGAILQFPRWVLNLSPFSHVPVISADARVLPLAILVLIAVGFVGLGLLGFRQRDTQPG